MGRKSTGVYPSDWPEIAQTVKDHAGWRCVRCGRSHDPTTGYCLTVHHLDLNPANCAWWNIPALCQRCHLSIQSRVVMERPWMLEHTEWFKPYAAGYYAYVQLGQELTRNEVEARLEELLYVGQPWKIEEASDG